MRRSLLRISLAALAPLLCAQSPGIIEGRVTNSVTGEGVAGVGVRFSDRHSYVHDTVTDSTGSYRITGLDDGDYHGTFTKDGFVDDRGSLVNPIFHVSAGLTALADKQLKPWGSLRGRVVDEDGKPAPGVRVEKDPTLPGLLDGDTVTDENGEFAFKDLPAGFYVLAAKPESKIRMQDGVRVGTVVMYYPSATELARAVRIPVRTGDNVSGIEIRLKSVPVHRVAGVVLNPAGKPVAHATVKLMGQAGTARQTLFVAPTIAIAADGRMQLSMSAMSGVVGPGGEPEVAQVEAREDGTFEFAAVQAGDWRLSAVAGEYDEVPLGGVASAPVADRDVEDIQIRTATLFSVDVTVASGSAEPPPTGRLCDPKGCVLEHGPIRISLTALEGQSRVVVDDPAKNMARINSVFPGRYRVMQGLGMQSDPYVAAVMWGGRDVKGQVVELTPGAGPFEVVYKSGLGKVRGNVEKGEGASVFLVSNTTGEIINYRQVTCGADGAFEIGQVPPGDYYILAFDHTEGGGLPADDLPASILPMASSVRVESGSTASVDLRANKWPW